MTTSELITALKDFPPNTEVTIPGYKDGVHRVISVEPLQVGNYPSIHGGEYTIEFDESDNTIVVALLDMES